ncbi:Asparagine-rich zinc finger protein AZF1 [Saccharomyces cerevisiae]|nr:Asparagine-rich zinc finger protein AZF1 [Saccharomyces cerevisiae]
MPPPTAQFMGPTQAGQNESQNQSSGEAGEQNQEHGQGPTPILNQSQPASSQPQHQQQRNESISYYTNFNQPRYSTDASINSFLNISDNVPPPSKRNSVYLGPNDGPDFEFFSMQQSQQPQFQPSSRRESNSMRPPLLIPAATTKSQSNGTNNSGNMNTNTDYESFFNTGTNNSNSNQNPYFLSSRNNSLKFNPEDFDFQFKRRNSFVRDLKEIEQRLRKHLNDEDNYSSAISRPLDKNDVIEGSEGLNKHIDESGMQPNIIKKRKKDDSTVYVKNEMPRTDPPMSKDNSTSAEGAAMANFSGKEPPIPDISSVSDDATNLIGATKVDQLMLIIQARKKGFTEKVNTTQDGDLLFNQTMDILPPKSELVGGVEKPKGTQNTRAVKKHECPYCHRLFSQATHLEVHVRSHIGYKPFVCDYCGKRFTQGGNLRTHERLHTGEKPYSCDICDKKFSRKGNLAAHLVTHQKLKPFVCKLENCNKTFTQLGNMKAHQNRFHKETLNALTAKLAEMNPSENIPLEERQLLEYFASIYKNSNRGIKGRGKGVGTKKSTISSPENHPASTILNPNTNANNAIANNSENNGNPEGNIDSSSNSNPGSHSMISPTQKDMGTLQSQFIQNNFNNSVNSSNPSNQPIINYNYTTLPHSRLGSSSSSNTNNNNSNFSVGAAPGVLMAPTTNNDFSFNLDQSNDNERSQQEQVRFKNINYKS